MKIYLINQFKSKIRKFFVQEQGVVAIITGLVLVLIIGFAALAIDASIWYSQKRQLQFAADAGAVGGAIALQTTGQSTVNAYATNDININNCTGANNCTIVAINNPPASGPNAGSTKAVEVLLSQAANSYLSQLFLSNPTLHVRAVATGTPASNCIVGLSKSGIAIDVKGGGSIVSPNCGVYSNSSAGNAVNVAGGGTITTTQVNTVGGVSGGGITATNGIITGASPVTDPLGSLQMPSFSGCSQNNFSLNGGAQTISPGVYCGGIKLVSTANLTMSPGIYFMDRGDFSASSQSNITANGVTIIMTSSTGSGYGAVKLTAGLTSNMSAPSSGPTAGILFFGDRNSSGISENFAGGVGQILSGSLYFPTNDIKYSGKAGASGNPCFQVIANTITVVGNATLGNNCPVTTGSIQLVE
ncbi:MAG: hypothetical protein H0X26_01690 [Alphaproteobacteria bacterium]|nr:hypothetical protein [Alphaproteobacteria bacterium]